ncbi:methyltransferase-like protein 25B isoform X2 [Physella acuta]|uniref:methyltransferase-like protein 25B isoform X2 n=1 Tax=Physella acuta TaxID=109671 RepID=UPI0027DE9EB9|nr:methyltransferase-like protein 25B isoform X2 [Physella acuta]
MKDFYTSNHWNKLPKSLQDYFEAVEPPDLAWMISNKEERSSTKRIIPLSLLALQVCKYILSLTRTGVDVDSVEIQCSITSALFGNSYILNQQRIRCAPDSAILPVNGNKNVSSNNKNGQCMNMQHIFRKHVKLKKQHEISKLGQVINLLSHACVSRNVVDVGAGLGHLSRLLTFQYSLKVTTIEAVDDHAPKAKAYDRELKADVSKIEIKRIKESLSISKPIHNLRLEEKNSMTNKEPTERELKEFPNHVTCQVNPEIEASMFLEVINQSWGGGNSFVLAGLHACGDLTPTILRVFTECSSAKGLASVACCYMKLSSHSNNLKTDVFPMSHFVRKLAYHQLSYVARELACHFSDAYHRRLKENSPHLKIHSYRAALQFLLKTISPEFKNGEARFVSKKGAQGSFTQYALENLKKIGINSDRVPSELMQHCMSLTEGWRRVVAFYILRLSLAPIVESFILLDRVMFLQEKGINSVLVPIFDCAVSPRNFALLAIKND